MEYESEKDARKLLHVTLVTSPVQKRARTDRLHGEYMLHGGSPYRFSSNRSKNREIRNNLKNWVLKGYNQMFWYGSTRLRQKQ